MKHIKYYRENAREKVKLFTMPESGWLCREQECARGTGNEHSLGDGEKIVL